MPRLLFIANNYYNKENVASNRTSGLLKYLPEFGWEVTLITYHPKHKTLPLGFSNKYVATVVEGSSSAEYKQESNNPGDKPIKKLTKQDNSTGLTQHIWNGVRKCWHFMNRSAFIGNILKHILELYYIIQYPVSNNARWKRNAIRIARDKCDSEHFDAILSSHNLPESHMVASLISKKYEIPWVADYRDLWSQNHYTLNTGLKQRLIQQREVQVIKQASVLTAINCDMTSDLFALHNKIVTDIPNGYDPEQINKNNYLRPKFTITHLGSLYNGKRNPEPLFISLSELIKDGEMVEEDISVDFYGPDSSVLHNTIVKYNLQNCVHQCGMVSKNESVKMQTSSQILLLLTWNHPKEVGGCPGKVFEYFSARRPIISLGYVGECYLSKILRETNAGIHISTHEALKETLHQWYNEWRESGSVAYHGVEEKLDEYSHRAMARKFADVLNNVVDTQHISANSFNKDL